jgi:hypothetical protein
VVAVQGQVGYTCEQKITLRNTKSFLPCFTPHRWPGIKLVMNIFRRDQRQERFQTIFFATNNDVSVFYDPWSGLDKINMSDVKYFVFECKKLLNTGPGPDIFIVFGHEMNGNWYPWGNQPEKYQEKFKAIAGLFHKEAPNFKICWTPTRTGVIPGEEEITGMAIQNTILKEKGLMGIMLTG